MTCVAGSTARIVRALVAPVRNLGWVGRLDAAVSFDDPSHADDPPLAVYLLKRRCVTLQLIAIFESEPFQPTRHCM